MDCCKSSFIKGRHSHLKPNHNYNQHSVQSSTNNTRLSQTTNGPPQPSNGTDSVSAAAGGVPDFSEFSLAELRAAINNFSSDFIVSESGEKAPNVVYKGRLQNDNNRRWIAIKKFTKLAWPDPKQFAVRSPFFFLLESLNSFPFLGFQFS